MHDAVLGPSDQHGGDLGLEAAGEDLHHPEPEVGDAGRDGMQPTPGEAGSLLQEPVKAEGVDREDEAVFQGDGVPGHRHPQEERDVAQDVPPAQDLDGDPATFERTGEFDRTAAHDVDAGRCLPHPEHGRPGWVVIFTEQGGERLDVVRPQRSQVTGAQPLRDPRRMSTGSFHGAPLPPVHRKCRFLAGESLKGVPQRHGPVRPDDGYGRQSMPVIRSTWA